MHVRNGHVSIELNKEDKSAVLIATELCADMPTGSRTATIILRRDTLAELLTKADQVFRGL